MEIEVIEYLAILGGFRALVGSIELLSAMMILSLGLQGMLHAWLFFAWFILSLLLGWRYARINRDWVEIDRNLTNELVEQMIGHRTRLAQQSPAQWHGDEDRLLAHYLQRSQDLDQGWITLRTLMSQGWLLLSIFSMSYMFILNPGTPATIAITLGGVLLAQQSLDSLTGSMRAMSSLVVAWEQVAPLQQAADSRNKTSSPIVTMNTMNHPITKSNRALLTARELTYHYPRQTKSTLNDCDLTIYYGDKLLLEGTSGGGKSTLASVLLGLRQVQSGLLLWRGVDQKSLGLENWRQRVASAPQFHENHIFTGTLAFNLLMGRNWPPSEDDLSQAEDICDELGLGELLNNMPMGLQQMVGESGWQLSHGERSRVYIARAILQEANFVVFDESFAALDPENLHLALECVLRRAPTLMVIAHP